MLFWLWRKLQEASRIWLRHAFLRYFNGAEKIDSFLSSWSRWNLSTAWICQFLWFLKRLYLRKRFDSKKGEWTPERFFSCWREFLRLLISYEGSICGLWWWQERLKANLSIKICQMMKSNYMRWSRSDPHECNPGIKAEAQPRSWRRN